MRRGCDWQFWRHFWCGHCARAGLCAFGALTRLGRCHQACISIIKIVQARHQAGRRIIMARIGAVIATRIRPRVGAVFGPIRAIVLPIFITVVGAVFGTVF